MLHREIPFLRIGVPLCAGIICGYYFIPEPFFIVCSAVIINAGFLYSLYFNRRFVNIIYGISLTSALFFAGLFLYAQEKSEMSILEPEEICISGFLSDYPEEKASTFRLILKMEEGRSNGKTYLLNGSIMLYHRKDSLCSRYLPGDKLVIRCKPVEITNRGNPFEFDYKFYMENRGIRYYAFTDSNDLLGFKVPDHRKVTHTALIIREKIIDMYRQRGIKGDRLALVAAITLGQKNMLDPEQKQYFIKAGVMHVMAVSGLHAVILSLFVFRVLFFLQGRFNYLRVILTLLILWSFAFVTGLTPSVMRATLMFSFIQAGSIMKRPVNSINSVLASAFILILINPTVIFDAGFLLSYSAVIFIICFYRDLYLKVKLSHRLPDLIWQSAAVSIIAQAGTLPLTIMLFNRFPVWFLLSNIIIVPVSSLVIIAGSLVPLTFPLVFISAPLARLLDFLTGLTEFLTAQAASLPYASVENIGMTSAMCILLTITIFTLAKFLLVKKSLPVYIPVGAFLLLVTAGTAREISTRRSSELIVYNSIGHAAAGLRTGKILNLYTDTLHPGPEVLRHCATLGLRLKVNLTAGKPILIRGSDKNILITNFLEYNIFNKHRPDIVIFTGTQVIGRAGQPGTNPAAAIVSTAIRSGNRFESALRSLKADTVHDVRSDGAYVLKWQTRLK